MTNTRSTVRGFIEKNMIHIDATDKKAAVTALKIHRILIDEFACDDAFYMEEDSKTGEGISLVVLSHDTTRELKEYYSAAKKMAKDVATTQAHTDEIDALFEQLHG